MLAVEGRCDPAGQLHRPGLAQLDQSRVQDPTGNEARVPAVHQPPDSGRVHEVPGQAARLPGQVQVGTRQVQVVLLQRVSQVC